MATVITQTDRPETFADLVERLGGIPLERIRLRPAPGTATEEDVVAAIEAPRKRLCELVDGVLVEKPMGAKESLYAAVIIAKMDAFADKNDLGIVLGADGTLRLLPGLVRIPDVSFISWDRIPDHELPDDPIPDLAPNLAVEVLSKSNTRKEMARKLEEYFRVGVELAWLIDPKTQTAEVYTGPENCRHIGRSGILDGGNVLPGFKLSLRMLFSRARKRKR